MVDINGYITLIKKEIQESKKSRVLNKITAPAKGKDIELDFGAKLQRERLVDDRGPIKLLQFSFDSKHLASLSWEGGVCLVWDVDNVAPPY